MDVWPIEEFTYLQPARWNGTRSADRMPHLERYWREADPNYCDGEGAESFGTLLRRCEAALARLTGLRGVGRWTAEYVLLRGLGRLHLFPGDDIGARNRLRRWLHLREPLDYERVRRLLRRWRPYAGLVYLHMLLDGLAEAKLVSPATIDDREARRRDGVGSPPRRATS